MAFGMNAKAEVREITVWEVLPGHVDEFQAGIKRAQEIASKYGDVRISSNFQGQMIFASYHENWLAWNKYWQKLIQDKEWQKVLADGRAAGRAKVLNGSLQNLVAATENPGSINAYQIFFWKPMPGQDARMYQEAIKFKEIHESYGAKVSIWSNRAGNMAYQLGFNTWEDMAKFMDTPQPKFVEYWNETRANPASTMTGHSIGSAIQ